MDIKSLGVLVRDLNKPRALTYWADLTICLILTSMGLLLSWPFPESILSGSPSAFCGLVLSAFALFRASYFNHELAHHAGELPGFEIVWNVSVGIPLLIPSYLYSDHLNHHSVKGFATVTDVEYFPPHLRGIRGAGLIVLVSLLLPLIYTSRFLLVVPVAWFSPAIRRWADTRASSLGILGLSRRKPPTAKEAFSWRTQELGCFAYLVLMSCAVAGRAIPVGFVLQINTLIVIMLLLHGIRVMVGHRYEVQGSNDRIEQVLDSFNFTRNRWATILMAPLGFHLHALHHLFPKIPYHNLQEAHRRISGALPPDSFYHSVEAPSYFRAVARFVLRGLSPTPSPDDSIRRQAAEGPVDGREEKPVNHGAGAAGPSLA